MTASIYLTYRRRESIGLRCVTRFACRVFCLDALNTEHSVFFKLDDDLIFIPLRLLISTGSSVDVNSDLLPLAKRFPELLSFYCAFAT